MLLIICTLHIEFFVNKNCQYERHSHEKQFIKDPGMFLTAQVSVVS
jgi:hypothetical protein